VGLTWLLADDDQSIFLSLLTFTPFNFHFTNFRRISHALLPTLALLKNESGLMMRLSSFYVWIIMHHRVSSGLTTATYTHTLARIEIACRNYMYVHSREESNFWNQLIGMQNTVGDQLTRLNENETWLYQNPATLHLINLH